MGQTVGQPSDPHADPLRDRTQKHRAGRARCFWLLCSHYLLHEAAHRLSGLVLHLAGGVGVGAEGEAGVVVAQHRGDGFDVHAVLEGCGGERFDGVGQAGIADSRFDCILMI